MSNNDRHFEHQPQDDWQKLQERSRARMKESRERRLAEQEKQLGRRKFMKLLGGAAVAGAGVALSRWMSGGSSPEADQMQSAGQRRPEATPVRDSVERSSLFSLEQYPKILEASKALARIYAPPLEDVLQRPGLNTPDLSFDIPMNQVPEVKIIRALQDPRERFLQAVNYLGVQTKQDIDVDGNPSSNPRYQNNTEKNRWTCNVYAQDLARLMLEKNGANPVVGHWTDSETNMPVHLSAQDRAGMTDAEFSLWNNAHRQMDSFDMMEWMQNPNIQKFLGWREVETQQQLFAALQDGFLGYAGTNPDLTKGQFLRANFHNYILGWSPPLPDFPQGIPLLSQSTTCRLLESDLTSDKMIPGKKQEQGIVHYRFFVHKIP